MKKYVRLTVKGIVQGVGFRPFLHRLARKYGITGWVRNTSSGLDGILLGEPDSLKLFLSDLETSPPPMALIEKISFETLPHGECDLSSEYRADFSILPSRTDEGFTLVSPDIAMCPECEAELYTPSDRRYRYPFINCTNCGPRYTIIDSLPYDRARTVMNEFRMCGDCLHEYNDIDDRRYHAQPDCCPSCGPEIFFVQNNTRTAEGEAALKASQELLARGGILAVKGIGGIHLACNALDKEAVNRLRARKGRREKPLALMCRSLDSAGKICCITDREEMLLRDPARPIILLKKKEPGAYAELSFSRRLGVMLPYTPLHTLLLDGMYGGPDILVMTSANISGCPVLTDNDEVLAALSDTADGFLLHNRRIRNRCDDSLAFEWQGGPYFLRRSRGYAPRPLDLGEYADGIFALGAEQKASFALGKNSYVFSSPYIGDLKNAETFRHFTDTLHTYRNLFHLTPSLYVCDLHPDYLSSAEALRLSAAENVPLLTVQHHWAHMASCMADNQLDTPCFGIIWDGTGLGTDGNIWGGEFFTGGLDTFTRSGSVRPVALPGGDRAVLEIGRIALSLLYDSGITDFSLVPLPDEKCRLLARLLASGYPPAASSIGRLFDGICSLILGRAQTDYEGEGAALVEALSPSEIPPEHPGGCTDFLKNLSYPLSFYSQDSIRFYDTRPLIRCIAEDLSAQEPPSRIALRFMASLSCMALEQCAVLNTKHLPVVLSGGVFQNRFLLHSITCLLKEAGFTVYTHHRVPANDEGIALGQLAIARKKRSMDHVSCNTYENQ